MIGARAALDAIGLLPDPEIDLADAAVQLARARCPELDWQGARDHLSELARDAASLPQTEHLADRAGLLAELIWQHHGYKGDAENYDDLRNANLITVIERRRGLPVALGILWLHCARAAGWTAHGVDFPGHFLVALADGGQQLVLDVFNSGMAQDASDLRSLLKQFEGENAELRPGLLRPMRAREVLLRLQNNIRVRQLDAGEPDQALVTLRDMLRIAPDAASLWRDAAGLSEQLEQVTQALEYYARFLDLVPDGDVAAQTRLKIQTLRNQLH